MRPYLCFLALGLAAVAAHSEPDSGARTEYEEKVGLAFAYTTGPDSNSRFCKKAFADLNTAIDQRVSEWSKRNETVLREIRMHWDSMVHKAAKDNNFPPSKLYEAVEQQTDQMLFSLLEKSDRQTPGYSRAYCQAFATNMLEDDRFQLEQALGEPLKILRACRTAAYCPQAKAAP